MYIIARRKTLSCIKKLRALGAFLLVCSLLTACRKDLIRYQKVEQIQTGTQNRLNRIRFVNDTLGFACGGDRFSESDILITRDGGNTWQLYISPDAHKELFGINTAPDGAVCFIGFDGNFLRTRDGGNSFRHFQLRFEAYKSLAFRNAGEMLIVGGISFERGDAVTVDTNGNTLRYDSLGYELNDIALLPDGSGWRCGYGAMQHTVNGGQTWEWQLLRNDNFNALDAHGPLVAYTCGAEGSICATYDGGASWTTLRNGNDLTHPQYRLQDLLFTDSQHGYAVGEKGIVIYTDDAGDHWSELEHFTDSNLHGIARNTNGSIFVCGENGELWKIVP